MYKERVVSEGKCLNCLSPKELLNTSILYFTDIENLRDASLVFSDLRWETKGSRFQFGC